MVTIKNSELYKNVKILNGTWYAELSEAVINADLSMSVGQVSNLSLSVDDPGWNFYAKHHVPLETYVNFEELRFSIASIELNAGGGEGGFSMECRPRSVRHLKNLRGKRVIRNVSPSQYVIEECKSAGVGYKVQPTSRRTSVSRDVPEPGEKSGEDKSAWSTINRLASEVGFLAFEVGGTIFFGEPTWFIKNMPRVKVSWSATTEDGYNATQMPVVSQSLDDNSRHKVSVQVPIERANDFRPGYGMQLTGVPRFTHIYFITDVDFPLAGPGDVSVTAETPFDPTPNPPQ
jgi:hypothetical protein